MYCSLRCYDRGFQCATRCGWELICISAFELVRRIAWVVAVARQVTAHEQLKIRECASGIRMLNHPT